MIYHAVKHPVNSHAVSPAHHRILVTLYGILHKSDLLVGKSPSGLTEDLFRNAAAWRQLTDRLCPWSGIARQNHKQSLTTESVRQVVTLSVAIDCRVVLAGHRGIGVEPPTRDWPYVVPLSLQVSTRIAWQAAKVKCVSKSEFIIIGPRQARAATPFR